MALSKRVTAVPPRLKPKSSRDRAYYIEIARKRIQANHRKRPETGYRPEDEPHLKQIMNQLTKLKSEIEDDQKTIAQWLMSRRPGSPQLSLTEANDVTGIPRSTLSKWRAEDTDTHDYEPGPKRAKPTRGPRAGKGA